MTEVTSMTVWILIWVGVGSAVAVALWLVGHTVVRELTEQRRVDAEADEHLRPLRPAGERGEQS